MTSRKIIDIANNLDFIYDYNISGITGNNSRITTTSYGEFLLYSTTGSSNSSTGSVVLYNGGLSINNTSNVSSITSGGALTIAGGASINKDVLVGGNVGIGISSPQDKLHVAGTIRSGLNSVFKIEDQTTFTRLTANEIRMFDNQVGDVLYMNSGIGIFTTPSYALDVSGGTRISNTLIAPFTSNTIGNIFTTGGNVGIGTTAPTSVLDISNSVDNLVSFTLINNHTGGNARSNINVGSGQIYSMTNGDTSFTIRSISQNTNGINILAAGAASVRLFTSNTERACISPSGNFGIGTTSPSTTLDVSGNARISTGLTTGSVNSTNLISSNISSSSINTTDLTSGNINFTGNLYQNGSLYISSQWTTGTGGNLTYTNGNVGIGTTSPIYRLDVNGNIRIFGTSSSLISSTTNVLQIQNRSSTGNSVIEHLDHNGNSKMSIGYANQSSNVNGLAASSYIMTTNAVSLNLIAGTQSSCPVILNPTDNSMSITCSTDAVDIYTGALNVAGGVGIANHLYVGDDLHVERDLYVNGAINGAAASSSTFAYMTITATDDAINYSTGSIVTFGGITIQSTADASSNTNGGSLLTAGGASIRKRLFVGQGINASGDSVLTNLSSTLLTVGNIITDGINLGISSIFSGSFTPTNNISSPSDVTGLTFSNSDIRSFTINLTASITRTIGGNLYEYFCLEGNQTDNGWDMLASSSSDVTGIVFTITSTGQVQYTSTNITNYQNSIFRYQVNQIANTGTYSLATLQTQGTLITNTIQILSTENSNIGVNNGSLYVRGGVTIDKTLYANSISTGTINTTGLTVGSLSVSSGFSAPNAYVVLYGLTVSTNITTAALYSTAQTTTNIVGTNISSATLNLSTGLTAASVQIINANVTTQTVATSRITSNLLALGDSNTIGNIFTTGGSIGVATTTPNYTLHVNGDVCATGDVISFSTISDRQLKQNIQNVDEQDALEIIKSLRPVFFEWKDDIFNKEKRLTKDVGFIAQEIEPLIPYAVSEYKNEENIYKNMKHERLIPYLVSSIQRLEKIISEQQQKINEINEIMK